MGAVDFDVRGMDCEEGGGEGGPRGVYKQLVGDIWICNWRCMWEYG